MSREQNRAAFPQATEMFDLIRATYPDARVLWARENGKEIGRLPEPDTKTFEVSAETLVALAEHEAVRRKRK